MAVNHDETCNYGYTFLPVLYLGRFLTGVGLSFSITGVPCYVAKLSPKAFAVMCVTQ